MVRSFPFFRSSARRVALLLTILMLTGCSSPDQRAQTYYENGMKYLEQKDYVKAGIEFKNAIQLKKNLVGAWRGLLQIETQKNNLQGQIPILREVVELDPKDVDAKLRLGRFLLLGKAPEQALEQANAAIAIDDHNPSALALKAAALLRLDDSVGAKRDANAALGIDPANVDAIIVLAAERIHNGDTEGALKILDRGESSHENNYYIQLFKLQIFEQTKDLKREEDLLHKLAERYPQVPTFQRGLVKLYIDQKRFDEAEKELRALSAANPSDTEAGLNVVRFLLQVKGPAEARAELMARIGAGGNVFKYRMALADFDYSQGKVEDSIHLLETLASNATSPEDVLAAQVKLARIQFAQKKFDAAQTLVSAILSKDGRNIDGLELRASIRMEQNQLDAAIADLRQAIDDQPRSIQLMLLLASAYERGGSIDLADRQYADAIKVSNYNVAVSLNYVNFLRRRGSLDRAEDILVELARRTPNDTSVLATLADVRLARKNWAGAQDVAETMRRIGETRGLSDQILAAALSGRGKYDDSIKILEGVQAAAPAAVQPLTALVNTMVQAKKYAEAEAYLQHVVNEKPADTDALVLLGSVQLLRNAPDQAVQSFQAAIERQPKNVAGYLALSKFYADNKKPEEAEKAIRKGLQQQPSSFALHLDLAGILELKGDIEGAIAENEYLLKQEPGSMIVANNLASLLSDYHTDKASLERAYALAAILRKSEIPAFKDTLGWIDYLRGDYKSATALLETAATAMPNRAAVQYHLGMSYVSTGQLAKASASFKKALELAPDSALQQKIEAAQKKTAM